MLRYNVEKPKTWHVQLRLLGRRKEEDKLNHIVYVNYKFDEFIYLLGAMNFVYDKVIAS